MNYNIELTAAEIVLVGECIEKMPLCVVLKLHNKIQSQISQQDAARMSNVIDFSKGVTPEIRQEN